MGLERGPLSLGSTTEELLGRKISASGRESENTTVGIRRPDHVAPCNTPPGPSVGIVRSRLL
jgi:hypothetical protein